MAAAEAAQGQTAGAGSQTEEVASPMPLALISTALQDEEGTVMVAGDGGGGVHEH